MFTEDGVIEGIENPNAAFCVGVQWHPEFLIDKKDIEIFKSLIKSSRDLENRIIRLSKILSFGVCSRREAERILQKVKLKMKPYKDFSVNNYEIKPFRLMEKNLVKKKTVYGFLISQ